MKSKFILLLSVAPLLISAAPSKAIVPTMNISSPQYGPYEVYQDDVETEFAVLSTINSNVLVYEKVAFKDMNKNQTRTITCPVHQMKYLSVAKIPITIPTSKYFGTGGMRISIAVFRSGDDYQYKSVNGIIYPPTSATVKPLEYLTGGYTTKTTAISFPNKQFKEKFTFHNFADYFLTDIYYRVPLEQFAIEVTTEYKDFPIGKGLMSLNNADVLFPNISSLGGLAIIAVDLKKEGDFYKISLAKNLYVHPKTLLMSDRPLVGYVATKNFYFPVNKMEDYQELNISFLITEVGHSKINLSWYSKCYLYSPLIGACSNSEYCVVGEVTK